LSFYVFKFNPIDGFGVFSCFLAMGSIFGWMLIVVAVGWPRVLLLDVDGLWWWWLTGVTWDEKKVVERERKW